MQIPTVKIALEDGYAVINEADFDPDNHELFVGDAQPDLSRDGIEKMKRADLISALVTHGMDEADAEGVNVPELREKLLAVVFVGD